jgi:hypothetical protein
VNLSEIVRSALAPFGDRIMIGGVDVMVDPEHVQNFRLHCTNWRRMPLNMALYQTIVE